MTVLPPTSQELVSHCTIQFHRIFRESLWYIEATSYWSKAFSLLKVSRKGAKYTHDYFTGPPSRSLPGTHENSSLSTLGWKGTSCGVFEYHYILSLFAPLDQRARSVMQNPRWLQCHGVQDPKSR